MLVVKVEIWPSGNEEGKREIAQMVINNVSSLADESDYVIFQQELASPFNTSEETSLDHPKDLIFEDSPEARGLVKNHNRFQSVWALIAKAASVANYS